MVGRASGGRCLAELWNICGLSRLRVAVARSCATSAGDGGDVGLGLSLWHDAGRLVGLCGIVFGRNVWLWLREAFHGTCGGAISGGKRLSARKNHGGARWRLGYCAFARCAHIARGFGRDGRDVADAARSICTGLSLRELADGLAFLMDWRDGT